MAAPHRLMNNQPAVQDVAVWKCATPETGLDKEGAEYLLVYTGEGQSCLQTREYLRWFHDLTGPLYGIFVPDCVS